MASTELLDGLRGESPIFNRVIEDAKLAALTDFNVLLLGATGTGKSLIAEGIHAASDRSAVKEMTTVDLGLLAQGAQEAELFGSVKGAYTGASSKMREGLIGAAHGSTIFFDEVGDASRETQSKLLRLLQAGKIKKMGADNETSVDVRVIAATNRDPKSLVQAGQFRADLYYRLKVIVLNIPPLIKRERGDFNKLTDNFLVKYALPNRKMSIDENAVDFLWEHPDKWPGNVRELEATIQRLIALSESTRITLSSTKQIIQRQIAHGEIKLNAGSSSSVKTLQELKRIAEKKGIEVALRNCAGSKTRAAVELGMSRRTLSRKVAEYEL